MTDFHKSLDAALTRRNPLDLVDPADRCPTCGTLLRDNRSTTRNPCPWSPHSEEDGAA